MSYPESRQPSVAPDQLSDAEVIRNAERVLCSNLNGMDRKVLFRHPDFNLFDRCTVELSADFSGCIDPNPRFTINVVVQSADPEDVVVPGTKSRLTVHPDLLVAQAYIQAFPQKQYPAGLADKIQCACTEANAMDHRKFMTLKRNHDFRANPIAQEVLATVFRGLDSNALVRPFLEQQKIRTHARIKNSPLNEATIQRVVSLESQSIQNRIENALEILHLASQVSTPNSEDSQVQRLQSVLKQVTPEALATITQEDVLAFSEGVARFECLERDSEWLQSQKAMLASVQKLIDGMDSGATDIKPSVSNEGDIYFSVSMSTVN